MSFESTIVPCHHPEVSEGEETGQMSVKGLFTGIAGKEAGSSCMLAVPQLPSQLCSSADEEQVKNVAIVLQLKEVI